jgi:hypothetical protein
MTRGQKILLVVGFIGVAIGGFALAKYLTRNTIKIVGGTIELQTYSTPSEGVDLGADTNDTSIQDDPNNTDSRYDSVPDDSSTNS